MPSEAEPATSDLTHVRPPSTLKRFVNRSFAASLVVISAGSGVLQFNSLLNWTVMLIVGLAIFGVLGWGAAAYVAYSSKYVVSRLELLLSAISVEIDVPFVESWLRATLLNQRAIEAYWKRDQALRMDEISIVSDISARDVRNTVKFTGRSESKTDVDCCPMLLIGGSTLHFEDFSKSYSGVKTETKLTPTRIRSVVDLGLLQLIDIVFPTLVKRKESFEIEHTHEWPGGMTPGVDIMWYPYATMFARETDRLHITANFDADLVFMRGYVANLTDGTCGIARDQPTMSEDNRSIDWNLDSVDNDEIYVLVFER